MPKPQEIAETTPIYQYIGKIWHYPLFQIGSNYLIIGNLLIAFVMIWMGLRYRKRLSTHIKKYIHNKIIMTGILLIQ